jgi:hypothetical protein
MSELDGLTERIAEVLAAHISGAFINSVEGWIECLCGAHLPVTFDEHRYPDYDESITAMAAHQAEQVRAVLGETTTEWGTAHSSDMHEVVPERLESTARAKVEAWNRPLAYSTGHLMHRTVTPWTEAP